jgi:hypothetical protein
VTKTPIEFVLTDAHLTTSIFCPFGWYERFIRFYNLPSAQWNILKICQQIIQSLRPYCQCSHRQCVYHERQQTWNNGLIQGRIIMGRCWGTDTVFSDGKSLTPPRPLLAARFWPMTKGLWLLLRLSTLPSVSLTVLWPVVVFTWCKTWVFLYQFMRLSYRTWWGLFECLFPIIRPLSIPVITTCIPFLMRVSSSVPTPSQNSFL